MSDASPERPELRRTNRARWLIGQLLYELPDTSPSRPLVRELYQLFNPHPPRDIQAILERVPGTSQKAKAERIGISKQWFNKLWHGTDRPSRELAQRIAEATGVDPQEVR